MTYTAEQFADLARTAHDPNAAEKAAAILNDNELSAEEKLEAVDSVLDCYGVEPLRVEGEWVDNYHGDIVASYINTGGPYTPTVVHNHETGELILTSYGDWLEEWERTHERKS